MKSKAQLIQESLLAEIEFFKKAGNAVAGIAKGLDTVSNLGKKVNDYDPSKTVKPSVKKPAAVDPQATWDAKQKEIDQAARKSQLMKKQGMTPAELEKARQEKASRKAVAKSISRNRKKAPASGIGAGIAKATPVPGQQAKPAQPAATRTKKLPTIGGMLPTDPRYPALAAKIAAAEKNK